MESPVYRGTKGTGSPRVSWSGTEALPATMAFREKYGPWAVVTGASSGLGAQFCRSLASRGLNLLMTARRLPRLERLAASLRDEHKIETRIVQADLSTPAGATDIAEAASALDVGLLVNNAGVHSLGAYLGKPVSEVNRLIAVNVTAVSNLASTIGRQIAARGKGGIVFVSSLGARPQPYTAVYAASKAFVSTLAVGLRFELRKSGVDVLSFEPGVVESEMVDGVRAELGETSAGKVDRAVESCLRKLVAGEATWTPGFWNRVFKFVTDHCPHAVGVGIMGYMFEKKLSPRLIAPTGCHQD